MKLLRLVRKLCKPLIASAAALTGVGLYGCGDPSSWNPPNNPKDVPSNYGPCGAWIDCGADQPKAERCCYPTTKCWVDQDGTRACVGDAGFDPSNPVIWGKKRPQQVFKRVPAISA